MCALFLFLGRLAALAQAVTLAWSPSPDTNAVGYNVYYGGASGVYTNTVFVSEATTVSISGLTAGATYYFSATTVAASGAESAFSEEVSYVIPPANIPPPAVPPTLDPIASLVIYQNSGLQTVSLTGLGAGSTNGNPTLLVSVVSSDSTIIPSPTVNYTSPNSTGTLTFAPAAAASGTATLTVTVDNGGASNNLTSQAFTVSVLPVPVVVQPPCLSPNLNPIPSLSIFEGASPQTVLLTGISPGASTQNSPNVTSANVSVQTPGLRISASSSNPRLIPTPLIRYASPGQTALLLLRPSPVGIGTALITVTVANESSTNSIVSQTFAISVVPTPPPTLNPVQNVSVDQTAGLQTITLTGITSGLPAPNQALKVTAFSNNPRLVLNPTIQYASPANVAQLTFQPSKKLAGTATITVKVTDENMRNDFVLQRFTITVLPSAGRLAAPVSRSIAVDGAASGTNLEATLTSVANANAQFSFQVTGQAGSQYAVQATSDLTHWTSLQTNTSPFVFRASTSGGPSQQFFRAVYLP